MKKVTLLLLSVILFSCAKETVEKPKHLLTEDEMANIIYDITMIQSLRAAQPQALTNNDVDAKKYIFKKYKIDSLTFAQNNTWYAADMENYEAIQKKASDRIKRERDAFAPKKDTVKQNKNNKPGNTKLRAKSDSLRQAALERHRAQQK